MQLMGRLIPCMYLIDLNMNMQYVPGSPVVSSLCIIRAYVYMVLNTWHGLNAWHELNAWHSTHETNGDIKDEKNDSV